MFGQSFQTGDLASVLALVLLEGLLSADNALVLAIMVRHLPKDQQQKALLYGLGGAFVFRLVAILFATTVLKFWFLQALGAAYLLYLPIRHFVHHSQSDEKKQKKPGGGFWPTVIAVEMTDIAFAIDSVLAGIAFIENKHEKIWVVYFGAMIGIVLLRLAAGLLIKALERYPVLDHVAYLLVGWVGVKLAFLAGHTFEKTSPTAVPFKIPELPLPVFWGVLLGIALIGTAIAVKYQRPVETSLDDEAGAVDAAKDLEISPDEKDRQARP
ncbi:MAG: TerC family protein [Fimbriimonas sp.]